MRTLCTCVVVMLFASACGSTQPVPLNTPEDTTAKHRVDLSDFLVQAGDTIRVADALGMTEAEVADLGRPPAGDSLLVVTVLAATTMAPDCDPEKGICAIAQVDVVDGGIREPAPAPDEGARCRESYIVVMYESGLIDWPPLHVLTMCVGSGSGPDRSGEQRR